MANDALLGCADAGAAASVGGLFVWGAGARGVIGDGTTVPKSSPVQVSAASWAQVSTSTYRWLAVKSDGTLWGCGYNTPGLLGVGDVASRSSPTQVGTGTTWAQAAMMAGASSANAIKTDGTLWVWGATQEGNGGLGSAANLKYSSPVQVGVATTWHSIAQLGRSRLARRTDGTIWSWGYGPQGALGHGDLISRSVPTQIGTGSSWASVATHNAKVGFAIKNDGTLWAWGGGSYNQYGCLGTNNTTSFSSPVQVGTGTGWSSCGNIHYSSWGLKTDGTLWTWGVNLNGCLGIGDTTPRSSPVQVGTGTGWQKVVVARYTFLGIRNGKLYACGRPAKGALGTGVVTGDTSSPVQVGSDSTWTDISSAFWQSAGIRT
jgi:alpha-tubulin suppressor-like RCC1 family protein